MISSLNWFAFCVELPCAQVVDSPVSILLCVIFALFSLEILVQCLLRRNYFLTFLFWLDVVGTGSLLFDLPAIYGDWQGTGLTSRRDARRRARRTPSRPNRTSRS